MFWFFGREACGILAPLTRDQTRTPRIGRRSLNHWTAREVPVQSFFSTNIYVSWKKRSETEFTDVNSKATSDLMVGRGEEL